MHYEELLFLHSHDMWRLCREPLWREIGLMMVTDAYHVIYEWKKAYNDRVQIHTNTKQFVHSLTNARVTNCINTNILQTDFELQLHSWNNFFLEVEVKNLFVCGFVPKVMQKSLHRIVTL